MKWPSIREFLDIPLGLTGNKVAIGVIDGHFPPHPDITTNDRRHAYLVETSVADAIPQLFQAGEAPWRSSHGLMTAVATICCHFKLTGDYSSINMTAAAQFGCLSSLNWQDNVT